MKQVAIVSGKGGTGKTTVVASLALLARSAVTADCDVDAANLALLLPGADGPPEAFFAGRRAEVQAAACTSCGDCAAACRFGAIQLLDTAAGVAGVDPFACEGCGVCRMVCPADAITLRPNQAGVWMVRETSTGPLVHARLGIAQDSSGKLVARVRELAREQARRRGLELVLIDGPPGIGCPVHAAVTGVDLLLAVTEPTPSGLHDLERIVRLAQSFQLQTQVLINKADLSELYTRRIHELARQFGLQVVGQLPFDEQVPRLLARGEVPLSLPFWAEALRAVWLKIHARLLEAGQPKENRDAAVERAIKGA